MNPIMLGDVVHIDEKMYPIKSYADYAGIVIAICHNPYRDDNTKNIYFYNFEDKKMLSMSGPLLKEWDKEIEKEHKTFGILNCIKRIKIGDVIHTSDAYLNIVKYIKKKGFKGEVIDIAPSDDKVHNILKIECSSGIRLIHEYLTMEYENNISLCEEEIKSIKETNETIKRLSLSKNNKK